MSEVTIFYNGQCTKCRGAMELLDARGVQPKVVEYLVEPPSADTIRELAGQLGLPVRDLVRRTEPLYEELGLRDAADDELVEALVRHPVLLQRPIVVSGGRAVIGRPPERVLDLFPGDGEDGGGQGRRG